MSSAPMSPDASDSVPRGKAVWLGAALLFLASLGIFANTLQHELVYDDFFLISPRSNVNMAPVVEDFGAAFELFGKEYWDGVEYEGESDLTPQGQALYRPLTMFLWAAITHVRLAPENLRELAALSPDEQRAALGSPYHVLNVIVNALVIVAFFMMVVRMFGNVTLAFLAAAFYAMHPLHSEAVAYVAGLSDLLTGLTVFLGTTLYLKAVEVPGKLRAGPLALMLLTFFLGLLAKESAVMLLAVVGLVDLMRTLGGKSTSAGGRLAIYGSLVAVFVGFLAIRYSVVGIWLPQSLSISRLDNVTAQAPGDLRVLTSFTLISKYLWLTLWPEKLSIDYSFPQIVLSRSISQPAVLAGLLLSLSMLVVGLVKLRRSPALGFGLLLFLGPTIFFSNMIVPIGTIFAERLTFLPSAGIAIAVAALFVQVLGRGDKGVLLSLQPVGLLLALVMIGALGFRTHERNKDFADTFTLFDTAAEVVPYSARVHHQLGTLYGNQNLYGEAIESFQKAMVLDGEFFQAPMAYARVLTYDEQYDAAVNVYERLLANLGNTNLDGSSNATVKAMLLRRMAETKRAAGDFDGAQDALDRSLDFSEDSSGSAGAAMVDLLQGQGRWAESLAVIEDALAIDPENAQFRMAQARAAIGLEDVELYEEALVALENSTLGAVAADAMRAEVQYNRATRDRDMAALEEATAVFERLASDYPAMVTPHVFLARYLMDVAGDTEAAMLELDKALQLDPLNAPALESKAVALLSANDHDEALKTLTALGGVNRDSTYWLLWADLHFALNDLEQVALAEEALAELGENPIELTIRKSATARQEGRVDDAMEILDRALVIPGNESNVRLLIAKGLMLLNQGRFDEALLNFDAAEASFGQQPDIVYDEYLPIRRATCLMALSRDVEAAGELERAEQRMAQLEWEPAPLSQLRAELLLRRAQLYARPGGVFHDPLKTESICQEGIQLTQGRYPPFLDLSIEAFVQRGELDAAIGRAREGATSMAGLPHEQIYGVCVAILEAARSGDAAKVGELAGQSAYPLHKQLAKVLGA